MSVPYNYFSDTDTLTVQVDNPPHDMLDVVTVLQDINVEDVTASLVLNVKTGGLIEFEICGLLSTFKNSKQFHYESDHDTLYIHLDPRDTGNEFCDMVYRNERLNVLISLNRNRASNLTGIEIVGLEKILETNIDIRQDQSGGRQM